jgi:hypothetical protein
VLDGLTDEADGIDVLDFAAGAEGLAGPPHRDVHVRAQRSLFHVAVAGSEIAQDAAQFCDKGFGVLRRTQVRL